MKSKLSEMSEKRWVMVFGDNVMFKLTDGAMVAELLNQSIINQLYLEDLIARFCEMAPGDFIATDFVGYGSVVIFRTEDNAEKS